MWSIVLLIMAAALTGACGDASPAEAPAPAGAAAPTTPPAVSAPTRPPDADAVEHEHIAPHGGALVELGDEFAHVELVLDQARGLLTAYVLDGEAESAVRIAQPSLDLWLIPPGSTPQPVSLDAVANALTGEARGDTSQFQASVLALKGADAFKGSVRTLTVRGQPFRDVPIQFPAPRHE